MKSASRRTRGNPLNALLVLGTAAVVFFAFYARQSANEFLYRPPPSFNYERNEDFQFISSEDGTKIHVFWAADSEATRTVLYFCGSSEDLPAAMPLLRSYQLRGFNVASFEYRGFGYSEGKPNQAALFEDGAAVYDFIAKEVGGDESSIILHGHSVGGAVAMEIATRIKPGGIILESSFTSAYNVLLGMDWIPGDLYRNKAKAENIACPVLLIHGEDDAVVPLSDAVDLANSFGDENLSRYIVPDGGHADLPATAGIGYWSSIESFVRKLNSGG